MLGVGRIGVPTPKQGQARKTWLNSDKGQGISMSFKAQTRWVNPNGGVGTQVER